MTQVTPGTVTPTIRFELGDGADVLIGDLQAQVYNSLGVLKYTATLGPHGGDIDITEVNNSPDYYYEITDLDVSDHLEWPGSFLTVTWTVLDSPVVFEPTTKFYSFIPTSSIASSSTVLTWEPVREEPYFVGYTIYRRLPDTAVWTYIGSSDFPTYVDTTAFGSELVALTAEYEVRHLTQDCSSPSGTELVETALSSAPATYRTDQALCLIVGQVVDVGGRPDTDQIVNFFIHQKDAPTTIGLTTFKQTAVTVPLTVYGKFAAFLVQGTLVTCEIPGAGYTARFLVPSKPAALLADLTMIPIELLRGE
jgi:hypothetical protein